MTRDNWTTATAGRHGGYGIIAKSFAAIFWTVCVLTLAWALGPNQTIIQ